MGENSENDESGLIVGFVAEVRDLRGWKLDVLLILTFMSNYGGRAGQ